MIITTENQSGVGKVILFRDSFGNALHEFFANDFSEAVISRAFPYDVSDIEGADLVVVEIVERNIDKEEGVNIIDCENVSRALSDALDEKDFIKDAYILEVSSPGLARTLKKDRHLSKSIGEEVEIKTYKPIEKCKEFSGILESFDEKEIIIDDNGTKRQFNRADIAIIRLALDF